MKVENNKVVTVDFDIIDTASNEKLETIKDVTYLHGKNFLLPKLEESLVGMAIGENKSINLVSADAYGTYNPDLVQTVEESLFEGSDQLTVGLRFIAETDVGQVPVIITNIENGNVTVDGNHPLVDKDITFSIKVTDLRDATDEELAHGHVHGKDGTHTH